MQIPRCARNDNANGVVNGVAGYALQERRTKKQEPPIPSDQRLGDTANARLFAAMLLVVLLLVDVA